MCQYKPMIDRSYKHIIVPFLVLFFLCTLTISAGGCDAKVAGYGVGGASAESEQRFAGWQIDLGRVRAQDPGMLGGASSEDLSHWIQTGLDQRLGRSQLATFSPAFRVVPQRRLSGSVDLGLRVNPETGKRIVALLFRLRGQDDLGLLSWEVAAELEDDLLTPLPTHVDRACDVLARALEAELRPGLSDDAWLSQTLATSQDSKALKAAIREVTRRKAAAHAPSLQRLLVHPDRDVVLATLGALGVLRDASAVPLIKDLMMSQDPEKVFAALNALADIGGEAAHKALSDVAEHAPPALRDFARELLKRVTLPQRAPQSPADASP